MCFYFIFISSYFQNLYHIYVLYCLCNKNSFLFSYCKCLLNVCIFYATDQELASFHHKAPGSKSFRLVGQMVSVTAAPVCSYSKKGTIDNMGRNECGCVPTKLDFQKKMASRIWPVGCLSLITATDVWGCGGEVWINPRPASLCSQVFAGSCSLFFCPWTLRKSHESSRGIHISKKMYQSRLLFPSC